MASAAKRARAGSFGAGVRSLGGPRVGLPLSAGDSVGRARELVEALEGTPVNAQRLLLRGVVLEDAGAPLGAYGFQEGDDLMLVRELQGGHCQVPCGIFDDPAMVAGVKEDSATIRKAMEQIVELGAKKDQSATDFNQMVRWVNTKEDHACKIIKQMGEYGLCQRCKLPSDPTSPFANDEEYVQALRSHHSVMTAAMKCKQNVDLAFVDKLDAAVEEMGRMYTAE